MNNIPVIDLIFIILIALMIIRGYVKGFVEEIFSWGSKVLAIGVAVFLYAPGAALIRTRILREVRVVPEILAFIAIFIIVILVLKMLEHVLKDVIAGAKLRGLNKFFGLLLGLIEGAALTALILFILDIQPLFEASSIIGDSIFAGFLLSPIRTQFDQAMEIMNTARLFPPAFRISALTIA